MLKKIVTFKPCLEKNPSKTYNILRKSKKKFLTKFYPLGRMIVAYLNQAEFPVSDDDNREKVCGSTDLRVISPINIITGQKS